MRKVIVWTGACCLALALTSVAHAQPKVVPPTTGNTPITYDGDLASTPLVPAGSGIQGSVAASSIGTPGNWDYWRFLATAGSLVTIEVHRTTGAMDPMIDVWFGTATDSAGFSAFGGAPAGITSVAFADDNNGIPHGVGGSFSDPRVSFVAPSSGFYTLTVNDFIGAGPADQNGEVPYEIHISGVILIPEPATLTLVGLGALGGVVLTRRRRKKAEKAEKAKSA